MDTSLIPYFFQSTKDYLANDKKKLKQIFEYNRTNAQRIIKEKKERLISNYKMAYGIVDNRDYGIESEFKDELELMGETPVDIKFFPIVPNIVNTLREELDRKYNNYYPRAVDEESINEAIEAKNKEITSIIIQGLQQKFYAQNEPKSEEEAASLQETFAKLTQVEAAYKTNYKTNLVKFSEHLLEADELRFNLSELSKAVFEDDLIAGERYIHIKDTGDDYEYEYLNPEIVAELRSPYSKCSSDSSVVHWIERISVKDFVKKYGSEIPTETLEKFKTLYRGGRLEATGPGPQHPAQHILTSARNYFTLQNMFEEGDESTGELLINVHHQYFTIPRKLGKLTVKTKEKQNGVTVILQSAPVFVTEDYVILEKAKYNGKKTLENLIEGEHIDWFYTNDVWYGIKTDIVNEGVAHENYSPELFQYQGFFIKMEKLDYQGRPLNSPFGSIIPVFGGKSNWKKPAFARSIVDMIKPYQVYHNYLMNKMNELLITEVMPFMMLNQALLGGSTLDDSWSENTLLKSINIANDSGFLPVDTTDVTANNSYVQNGVYNLDRSAQIQTRKTLAEWFKLEAYNVVGVSPQFLGTIGSEETATGVLQGINRSALQLQHLYSDHASLMKRVKQYTIELAQIKHFIRGGMVHLSYINSDQENITFKIHADELPITRKVGVFVIEGAKNNEILEKLKQRAYADNTSDISEYERALILRANSEASLLRQLKERQDRREKLQEEQARQASEMQQKEIEARERQLEIELAERQKDRDSNERIAVIKSAGFMNEPDANGNGEFDILEIAKLTHAENQANMNQANIEAKNKMAGEESKNKLELEKEKIKLEREKMQSAERQNREKNAASIYTSKINKN